MSGRLRIRFTCVSQHRGPGPSYLVPYDLWSVVGRCIALLGSLFDGRNALRRPGRSSLAFTSFFRGQNTWNYSYYCRLDYLYTCRGIVFTAVKSVFLTNVRLFVRRGRHGGSVHSKQCMPKENIGSARPSEEPEVENSRQCVVYTLVPGKYV